MATRGCACGCDDPDHLEPPVAVPAQGSPEQHKVITLDKLSPLFARHYGCVRQPLYRYIGTVYDNSFFVPQYPYEDRTVHVLGAGGGFRAATSGPYPVFNTALQEPTVVATSTVPASYSQLPLNQGWHPGEENFIAGTHQYITCVREIRYYDFGNLGDHLRRYMKMWDWYELNT